MREGRGEDGAPLPDSEYVLRFGYKPLDYPQDGRALPVALGSFFELSSGERSDPPVRLSVFAESLTTREQGWRIAGGKHDFVLRISVEKVRRLRQECGNPELDVVWHHVKIELPGAEGHAGITGLGFGDKPARKFLRLRLADLSESEAFPPPPG